MYVLVSEENAHGENSEETVLGLRGLVGITLFWEPMTLSSGGN